MVGPEKGLTFTSHFICNLLSSIPFSIMSPVISTVPFLQVNDGVFFSVSAGAGACLFAAARLF